MLQSSIVALHSNASRTHQSVRKGCNCHEKTYVRFSVPCITSRPNLTKLLIHHYGLNTEIIVEKKFENVSQKVFYDQISYYSRTTKVSLCIRQKSVSQY